MGRCWVTPKWWVVAVVVGVVVMRYETKLAMWVSRKKKKRLTTKMWKSCREISNKWKGRAGWEEKG